MIDIKSLYERDPRVSLLAEEIISSHKTSCTLTDTSFDPIWLAHVVEKVQGHHIIVLPDEDRAVHFGQDMKVIHPKTPFMMLHPSFEYKSKSIGFPKNKMSQRATIIDSFRHLSHGILVSYPDALIELLSVRETAIKKYALQDEFNIQHFIDYCDTLGYERSNYVYEYGQYAIRGNIIDVYSYSNEYPYRIELFDITIEDIRTFDIETQLSVATHTSLVLKPSPSLSYTKSSAILSDIWHLFHTNCYIWYVNTPSFQQVLNRSVDNYLNTDLHSDYFDMIKPPVIKQNAMISSSDSWHHIVLSYNKEPKSGISPAPLIYKNFNKLHQEMQQAISDGYRVLMMAEDDKQFERYRAIFQDLGASLDFIPIVGEFDRGFRDEFNKLLFLTTHEIFNKNRHLELPSKSNVSAQTLLLKSIRELKPGDFVTHIDHGVGRFSGLEKIETKDHIQEAVRLIYANNDILYVHINSLYKISKYVGKDAQEPKLNKLGSDTWQHLKRKTKKKIKDIAEDLIKLYAKRKASKGFGFSPDTYLQYELESSFQYEDTPDQTKTTAEVKSDMEREMPMDRLVCGDVGFGKTEIAVRASFKAVADSKQVAILVPTTILAFQHFRTFQSRLSEFPCTVEFINRFKSAKQKKDILQKLKEGKIDILIGTHALVSKSVEFKDLGLLIVDEEQKFGVGVKEKLKEMKLNVDTLTLTATPIPRTLQFSLLGARDYSLIQTPPPNRSPVYTECIQFDPNLVKEIIENETMRGGQVFFVHNRVKDLDQLYNMLHKVLPNIDIAKAHGQLSGDQLEDILVDFVEGKYDVLLSTNIIESGIDIPNANTIIINNAHHFGMSDLHQLRGRVGRGQRKAYCYLMSPPLSTLTSDAKQRLHAIEQNAALGSGFQIAMRDLDLRGAGNLLGGEQSGFISDIGYDTFFKILDETIQELKENEYKDLYEVKEEDINYAKDCLIETDYDMYIPDDYIVGSQERMSSYTELNNVQTEAALTQYLSNLKDIYGPIPDPIIEIAHAIRLKWVATKLGIERINIKNGKMKCYLIQNQSSKYYQSELFGNMLNYIAKHPIGTTMKQTPIHVLVEFNPFATCQEAREKLESIALSI